MKAVIISLARNENVWGLASSIQQVEDRFNRRYNYDWVFLNDVDFSEEFRNITSSLVSGAAYYGKIPEEHWSIPTWIDEDKAAAARKKMADSGVSYGDSLSYRHMCRFESGFFFRHPLLEDYDYYWRVEPDVKFFCDLPYDPFRFMHENNKKYGFTHVFEELVNTIPTLWDNVKAFMATHPQHIALNNSLALLSDDEGETYTNCHFWSNFEIGSLAWLRSQTYLDFFNHLDQAGGFFYERWGDAPVHSIAASLLLSREEVHFFDDIGYYHYPYTHCPNDAARRKELKCSCNPGQNHDWVADGCTKRWYGVNGLVPPDG
jgi:alpha 1,2-mannosyltransferase